MLTKAIREYIMLKQIRADAKLCGRVIGDITAVYV